LNGILKSGATVALVVSLFLDSTIPTSHAEERGLGAWHASRDLAAKWWEDDTVAAVYALPWGLSRRFGEARLAARAKVKNVASGAWRRAREALRRAGAEKKKKEEPSGREAAAGTTATAATPAATAGASGSSAV